MKNSQILKEIGKMEGLALDTNIAIDILNGKDTIIKKVFEYFPIYLPITVVGELLFGALNSSMSLKNIIKYKEFIDDCLILNTTTTIAEEYAETRKQLKNIGKPIPENDLWIAAICKSYELSLISNDNHFKYIDNLKMIE